MAGKAPDKNLPSAGGSKGTKGTRKKQAKNTVGRGDRLTDNQEAFCIYLIIDGMSQRERYRKAYPNCTAKDSTVDSKASRLRHTDKVRARIDQLMDDSRRRRYRHAVANRPKVEQELMEIAMGTKEYPALTATGEKIMVKPTIGQRVKALSELNKIFNGIMDKNEFGEDDSEGITVIVSVEE